MSSTINLEITQRTDSRLLQRMENHYSKPKGFVGRSICYAVTYKGSYFGHVVAGSATRFLPGRNDFFGIEIDQLNSIVNNIFYNVSPVESKYPERNFTSMVLLEFEHRVKLDWKAKYGDDCIGLETLVELPRTGETYKRAGWQLVGETKGYTCKRTAGKGTDSWSGKRVWCTDADKLRPKIVLCKKVSL